MGDAPGASGTRDRGLRVLAVLAALLVAGGVALLIVIAGRDVPTVGPSMRPTITGDQSIEIDTEAYDEQPPRLGDIVVLQGPASLRTEVCGAEHPNDSPCAIAAPGYKGVRLIKRVVGLPGNSIAFSADGGLIRDGEPVAEPYVRDCPGNCGLPTPIIVPDAHVFVAGDNRPASTDSRYWGAVPIEAIDGRVTVED